MGDNHESRIYGYSVTERDQFWLDYFRVSIRETMPALEEAAKQLVAILGFCQMVYFASLSFSEIKLEINALPTNWRWAVSIIFVLPVLFWLLSLIFAVQVFKPKDYQAALDSPEVAQNFYNEASSYKQGRLSIAYRLLWFGFVPMITNIILYFLFLPVVNP